MIFKTMVRGQLVDVEVTEFHAPILNRNRAHIDYKLLGDASNWPPLDEKENHLLLDDYYQHEWERLKCEK